MNKFMIVLMGIFCMISCSKDKEKEENDKGEKSVQLREIVPEAFLNEAKEMGFNIYEGENAPNIKGKYKVQPWRYDGDNYNPEGIGTPVGTIYPGFTLNIVQQRGKEIDAYFEAYYSGYELSKPFILGDGNNFTICFHLDMIGGYDANFSFPYMRLISGTLENGVVKNLRMADIGLKLSTPNLAGTSVEGQISLYSDTDKISERIE